MSGTRCLLFFPGTRPELLAKALATGVDRVCMDLEDAVAAESKDDARSVALGVLHDPALDARRFVLRINHPRTPEGRRDIEAIASRGPSTPTLMVPKADGADELDDIRRDLARADVRASLIPVIETARGLADVESITAADGVSGVVFGGLDLSIDLGASPEWEALLYGRSRTVHAARLAGVGVVDMPFFDISDPNGLRLEAERVRRLGFSGKAAIHPSQVGVIQAAFTPSGPEIARARRLVEAYDRERKGAFLLDGVMIDRPAVEAARSLLARTRTGGA
jgi:citrate lyase beta subunit